MLAAIAFGSACARADEAVSVPIGVGTLSGTLSLPAHPEGRIPVALIIAGSGPTDRDGNSPVGVAESSYRKLADALNARGIATLRYDKRSIGASHVEQRETDLRFDDYVSDARTWVAMLSGDRRFSGVYIIGHSEGSLIGMLVAQRDPSVAGFISLEGAGRDLATIIDEQIAANPANPPAIVAETHAINASLRAGKPVANVSPVLMPLFRPSVQPFVISEYAYNPSAILATLQLPVLLVSGTHDIQIAPTDVAALSAADPHATVARIEGMNHLLIDAPAERSANIATYFRSDLPLDATLAPTIAAFITASKH